MNHATRRSLAALILAGVTAGAAPVPAPAQPTPDGMQALFDLAVRLNRARLNRVPQFDRAALVKEIERAEREQMGGFDRVATPTASGYGASLSTSAASTCSTRRCA